MIYLIPQIQTEEGKRKLKPFGSYTEGKSYPVVYVAVQPGFATWYWADDNGQIYGVEFDRIRRDDLFRIDMERIEQAPKKLAPKTKKAGTSSVSPS